MKKLNLFSMEELKEEIRKNRAKIEKEFRWAHKDRRHKALQNEYMRRVGGL